MSSTFSPSIHLEEPGLGDYNGGWNVPVNSNFSIIDQKFGTINTLTFGTNSFVLTNVTSAYWGIVVNGVLTSNQVLQFPLGVAGTWFVFNGTTGGSFTLTVKGSSGDTGFILARNQNVTCQSNGANAFSSLSASAIIAGLGYTPANKAGDTFSGAVTFSAGITVSTNGIAVTAGDLTLTSGSATLTNGDLTLSNGTLSVSGGAATFNNGAAFAAGLTVSGGTAAIGAATATTATVGDNSTNVATTAFVTTAVNNVLTVAALSVGAYAGASQGVGISGTAIGATVAGSTLTSYPSASATGGTTLTGIWEFMGRSGAGDGNSGNLWRRDS